MDGFCLVSNHKIPIMNRNILTILCTDNRKMNWDNWLQLMLPCNCLGFVLFKVLWVKSFELGYTARVTLPLLYWVWTLKFWVLSMQPSIGCRVNSLVFFYLLVSRSVVYNISHSSMAWRWMRRKNDFSIWLKGFLFLEIKLFEEPHSKL